MNYYRHHINDFQAATLWLDDAQTMAYLRLLWMYYDKESPLEDDPVVLARKCKSDPDTVAMLLQSFFQKDGDVWRHERCETELRATYERSEKAAQSIKARWDKQRAAPAPAAKPAKAKAPPPAPPPTPEEPAGLFADESTAPKFDPLKATLPEQLDPAMWAQWVGYRRKRKLPCNELTIGKQLKNIAEWAAKGHDVNGAVEQSIANGWNGLFEPKTKPVFASRATDVQAQNYQLAERYLAEDQAIDADYIEIDDNIRRVK